MALVMDRAPHDAEGLIAMRTCSNMELVMYRAEHDTVGLIPLGEHDEMELIIDHAQHEAEGVVSLRLVDPEGRALPEWAAGAHIDVVLPSGLVRQYSLCGPRSDRHSYTIAVLRNDGGRGGSLEVHAHAEAGRRLTIRAPRNNFELTPSASYVFIAGGIGITPIRAMIEAADAQGVPWALFYGGRTRAHMAFAGLLQEKHPGRVTLCPQDTHGILDLEAVVAEAPVGATVYACGPEPMLTALTKVCESATPARALRLERFAALIPGTGYFPKNEAFEIELRRTGVVLPVPADRSILSVAREVIPNLPSSCEEGVCGSCETSVLEGVPDHRDSVLTSEEQDANDTMMICVGRSCSRRLVLDI